MTRAAAPAPPPPDVQVTASADADKSREWWDAWSQLAPIERRRPAAEVLAEIRETDNTWSGLTERLVIDASAGVEILSRSLAGRRLAKTVESPEAEVWTVEHFHLEVARVLRRDVLAGDIEDNEATRRVHVLADW